jgi:hypothetical protein
MPSFFRYRLALVLALLLATGGCTFCDNIETVQVDTTSKVVGPYHYTLPANIWIDNSRMASYLRGIIEKNGRRQLGYVGYDCSPRPVADCPDCLLCTEKIRGVKNGACKPEGDLFIRAYVGPGSNVQAQTYWRK